MSSPYNPPGAGRSLGELGVKKVAEADTFGWFGEEMRIGNVSELLMIDFLDEASRIEETDKVAAMKLMRDAFRSIVDEADYARWWEISLREKQTVEDLMYLMKALVEGSTGLPIKRRSGSSRGRRDIKAKSRGGSSSPGTRSAKPVARKVMDRMERTGRADLAIAIRTVQPVG